MEDGITRYRVTDVVLLSAGDLTALATALEARGMAVTQRAHRRDRPDVGVPGGL